ncbi:MAG: HYR domain-containing protein [Verrucomicrobia bacterium]|nr:HYR domain-containing protein [Verrucomicrobiota bacterium]
MKDLTRTLALLSSLLSFALLSQQPTSASTTLTFDDVARLSDYAPLGVTFSANASIWTHPSPSVQVDPDGGAYSVPSALQFGSAGGVLGSIFFASDVSAVSIWALSGPGPDLLNAPMWIRAFDASGTKIDEDNIDPTLQFDFLSITAPGIRRLDLFSPLPNNDVWDNLSFSASLVDLVANPVAWDTVQGGVNFSYTINGSLPAATTAALYWANGPNFSDIPLPLTPVWSRNLPQGSTGSSGNIFVDNATLGTPPPNATHLLLVVDPPLPNGLIAETDETNNLFPLAISTLDLVDPNPGLLDPSGQIITPATPADVDRLSTQGLAQRTCAVADGVTKILLRVQSTASVTFSLPSGSLTDGSLDALPASGGTPATSITVSPVLDSSGNSWAFAVYNAPDFSAYATPFTSPPLGKLVDVQASFGSTVMAGSLRLEPLPVILVHGIWSSGDKAWIKGGFKANLEGQGFTVYLADYGWCSDCDFDWNLPLNINEPVQQLYTQIDVAKNDARRRGIAITQVDVIAHSMGGLVTRARAARPDYLRNDNFMKGDIHKLITIGTPHFGSALANWLVKHKCDPFLTQFLTPPFSLASINLETLFNQIGMTMGPAVYALQEGSQSIVDLGGTQIPTHAIAGIEPFASALEGLFDTGIALTGNFGTSVDGLLGGEMAHDCLVSRTSQFGGLSGQAKEEVPGVVHAAIGLFTVGETSSSAVQAAAYFQLFQDPNPNSPSGNFQYLPPPLANDIPLSPYNCPILQSATGAASKSKPLSQANALAQSPIISLTPAVGSIFQPGQQVQIDFQITAGNPVDGCFIFAGESVVQLTGSGPFNTVYTVPDDFAGTANVVAFTFGPGPDNYGTTTSFLVQPSASLSSISVSPSPIHFSYASQRMSLMVHGNYNDGVQRNIGDSSTGTSYSTQSGGNAVVSVSGSGLITAQGNGQDVVLISNGGVSASVPVDVQISNDAPALVNPGAQSMLAGNSLDVTLTATDPNGNAIRLSLVSAPAFVTLTDNGNGTGTLHLAPSAQDVGAFSAVVAAADNGLPPLGATQTFTIDVTSNAPLAITCPTDITVSNSPGLCFALVSYPAPVASGGSGSVSVVCNPPSGSSFPVGTNVVNCTATDSAGNTATCSFNVVVKDTEPPVIVCPPRVTVSPDVGQCFASNVALGTPSVSDNCGVVSVVNDATAQFSPGLHTVTWTATDASGNTVQCQQDVFVDGPVPVVTCPANIVVTAAPGATTAVVGFAATATDSCFPISTLIFIYRPQPGSDFPLGTTTVDCLALNLAGLIAQCSFTVTINASSTPLTIACPADVVVANDPSQCSAAISRSARIS